MTAGSTTSAAATPTDNATLLHSRPVVYEATATGFPKIGAYLRETWERRSLIWHLTRTDLKSEHYDTVLGQIWIILDPLLVAGVYYFVRTIIRPVGAADRGDFIAHIIVAVFFFQYGARAVSQGAKALLRHSRMILNTGLPRLVFPVMSNVRHVADFVPTLAVYYVIHAALGQQWSIWMVCLPLIAAVLTVFNLGTTLLFSTLTVFFRDTTNFLSYTTRLWLFASPVLYRVDEIPDHLAPYLKLNPLYPFLGLVDQVTNAQAPGIGWVLGALAWTLGIVAVGGTYFLWREHDVPVRL